MMSLQTIRQESQRAARKAARLGTQPAVLFSEDTALEDIRKAPFLGDHVPEGWRRATVDQFWDDLPYKAFNGAGVGEEQDLILFCDTSGFGEVGEPALTIEQLGAAARALVRAGARDGLTVGAGLESVGQFQAYVAVFVKAYDPDA